VGGGGRDGADQPVGVEDDLVHDDPVGRAGVDGDGPVGPGHVPQGDHPRGHDRVLALVRQQAKAAQLPGQPVDLGVVGELAAQRRVLLGERVRPVVVAVRVEERGDGASDRAHHGRHAVLHAADDGVQEPPGAAGGLARAVVERDQGEGEDE
jgi:hypothetical protein